MQLKEIDHTIGDIDLGGFSAEDDHRLSEHFIHTSIVNSILKSRGRKYIILGRKGSGKSALFRELPRLAASPAEGSHLVYSVLKLTPDAYAWQTLVAYREQGLNLEHAHANAWKLTLAVELAAHLVDARFEWHESVRRSAFTLQRFVEANFPSGSDLSIRRAVHKGIDRLDVSALGFGIGMTRSSGGDEQLRPMTPAVTDALLEHIYRLLGAKNILVEIDRLDDAWEGKDEERSLIVGLLRACKDLNDKFGERALESRVVLFLRTDIYDSLNSDESDKYRQGELRISWDENSLEQLIAARLPQGVTPRELFESSLMRGKTHPFNYLLRRTFYRPREVLQYLDAAMQNAGDAEQQISKENLQLSEATFSAWKVKDLKQEYARAIPSFADLVEALRQQRSPFSSIEEIEDLLRDKASSVVGRVGARQAAQYLWSSAAIGARLNDTGPIRYISTAPDFELPVQGRVYVHQGLQLGLNVKEKRLRKEDDLKEDSGVSSNELLGRLD